MLQAVSLEDMLAARERRAAVQQQLLEKYRLPLISYTLNIPGPIKDSPLIRRAFHRGKQLLYSALAASGCPVVQEHESLAFTGCELLMAVSGSAAALKVLCQSLEEGHPLGRLFDMDVLDAGGQKLDRAQPRSCIVCGAAGRGCASRRLHSVAQLQAAVNGLLEDFFLKEDSALLSCLITHALKEEVETTPKPGLVDSDNNGSHRDMTLSTFLTSADALKWFWSRCFALGHASSACAPEETFRLLRAEGRLAEDSMYAATSGVNTHKGAIFTFGCISGALGRLWDGSGLCRDPGLIVAECRRMSQAPLEAELDSIRKRNKPATAGEQLFLSLGLTGIRGELFSGLPGVFLVALPVFEKALAAGRSRNDAGAVALLHLIARGQDTNMIARGGPVLAAAAAEEAASLLRRRSFPTMDDIRSMDRQFISKNLSPGGCADLLAVTYFIHDLKNSTDTQEGL